MKTRKVWADFGPESRSDGDYAQHAQPPQACKGDDVLYIGALHKITSIAGMVNNLIVETKGILGARTSRETQAESMDPAAKAAKAAAGGKRSGRKVTKNDKCKLCSASSCSEIGVGGRAAGFVKGLSWID